MLSVSLTGCNIFHRAVNDELHYPGGLAGKVLDDHYIVSARYSKQLQLYRYAMALAVFSRIGTVNVRGGKEGDAFIAQLGDALDELNYSAGHIYPVANVPPCAVTRSGAQPIQNANAGSGSNVVAASGSCLEFASNFESDLPLLEHKLLGVAFAAMPKEQAVALYNKAKALDPLGTGRAFLNLAVHSLVSFHRGAAVHRTNLELLYGLGQDHAANTDVLAAYCALRRPPKPTGNRTDDLCPADVSRIAIPNDVSQSSYGPLENIIRTSCLLVPLDASAEQQAASPEDEPVARRRKTCGAFTFKPKRRLAVLDQPAGGSSGQNGAAQPNGGKP